MKTLFRMTLTLLLGVALILCLAPAACAESGTWGSLDWNLDKDGLLSITGEGKINDFFSTDSGTWREYVSEIRRVEIGEGVTGIGARAFDSCTRLTEVTIPSTVRSIGESAFEYCLGLQSAMIPEGVTEIGACAFWSCNNLKTIMLPASVTKIGEGVFFGCDSLTDVYYSGTSEQWSAVVLEDGNEYLSEAAVYFLKGFGTLDGLTWVLNNDGLLTVSGSGSIRDFAYNSQEAWRGKLSEIRALVIEAGVAGIGHHAFFECENLKSIRIPSTVDSIGQFAFCDCISLTDIEISEGVAFIGSHAFARCDSLKSVTVPASVTKIETQAFGENISLDAIHVAAGSAAYRDVKGVLFKKDMKTLLQYPGALAGDYAVPAGVTTIAYSAFEECAALTGVTIPEGVAVIDEDTFRCCTGLTSVTLPNSLMRIGAGAFYNCTSLSNLIIPAGVTSIDEWAFYECGSLKSVAIPSGVTSISQSAFASSGLTSVTVPGNVESIEESAFESCKHLSTATILNGVETISFDAFEKCVSLKTVTIPASVTLICEGAFYDCISLSTVFYGGTAAQWEQVVIGPANDELTEATICYGSAPDFILPTALTDIGEEAFEGGAFTFVELSENTVTIKKCAFADCPNLAYIYIPALTTQIDTQAFGDRTKLTIYGASGSTAESYAQAHGFTFVAVA